MRQALGLTLLAFLLLGKVVAADEAENRAVAAVEKLGGKVEQD